MTTTVLLLCADRAELLRHSLPAALEQDDAEVVVVDNASSDDTPQVTKELGARHLRFERRLSYCEANNAAIAATGGDSVLLLNSDCFLEPGFLKAARPRLAEDGVGAVAPKLIRTEGPLPEQRLDAIDAAGMWLDRRRKNGLVGHGRPSLAYDAPGEAFGADGAAALFRREMLDQCAVRGEVLDETFEKWACDVDLAWRGHRLGWRCAYEPGAVAYHVRSYGPATRARTPERDRRLQFRNRYLMMVKNDNLTALGRDLPRVAAWEALALGHALLRERHLLRGYAELWRLYPEARRRRAAMRPATAAATPFGMEPRP